MKARKNTIKVLELLEDCDLWELWARETLCYLSDMQVKEIAHTLELFGQDNEDNQ